MKTIDFLIDFLDRIATPSITETKIEIIENKLLDLALERDAEAARQYADLHLCRMKWERTRYAEDRQHFVDQAQDARAWLDRRRSTSQPDVHQRSLRDLMAG
jgi:hypothetical protein